MTQRRWRRWRCSGSWRVNAVSRGSRSLATFPLLGTPERDRWVEEHPPILRVAGAEETAS